jgi:hypothetical protein
LALLGLVSKERTSYVTVAEVRDGARRRVIDTQASE